MRIKTLSLCIASAISLSPMTVSASEIINATMSQDEFNSIYIDQTKLSGAAKEAGLAGTGWNTLYDSTNHNNHRAPKLIPDALFLDESAFKGGSPFHNVNAMSARNNQLIVAGLQAAFSIPYSVSGDNISFGEPTRTDFAADIAYKAQILNDNLLLVLESNKSENLDWPSLSVKEYRAANPDKNVFASSVDEQNTSVCRLYDVKTGESKTIQGHSCAPVMNIDLTSILAIGTDFDNPLITGYGKIGTNEQVYNELTLDSHSTLVTEKNRRSRMLLSDIIPDLANLLPYDQHATLRTDNLGNVYIVASAYEDSKQDKLVTFVYKTSDGVNWSNVTDSMYHSPNKGLKDASWPYQVGIGRDDLVPSLGLNTFDYIVNPDNTNTIMFNNDVSSGKNLFETAPYIELKASNHSPREAFLTMDNIKLFSVDDGATWSFDSKYYNLRALEQGFINVGNGYYLPYSHNASESGFAFAAYGETPSSWYDFEAIGSFELMAYDPDTEIIFTGVRGLSLNGEVGNAVQAFPRHLLEKFYTWPMNSTTPTPTPDVTPSLDPTDTTDNEVNSGGGGGGSFGFISLLALGLISLTRRKSSQ
ncbi:GlyGly-CTERM sorting domain-containing protein [Motilimonas cestriensis]|uniref:GlyGly-CTERM sorting domain-containing protein n=1 Tax=Motilimonas cestriensis TaxID=2742685 RepID=UPI003DA411D4